MAQAALVAYAENVQFSSTTVSITIPTNVQVGNTMLLQIHRGPTGSNSTTRIATVTQGSGWTELNSNIAGSATTTLAFIILTKVATASDPGSVVSVGNVDPTGIVQGAIFTAWTGPIVRNSASIGGTGSGTALTFSTFTPTASQTTGNTQLVLGTARSNAANGSVGFYMPATGSFASVPVSGFYSTGIAQSIQGFIGYGTIPTTKTSTLTVNGTSTLNSRAGYWIELGPGANYARNLTARVSMTAKGVKNPIGYGKPLRATVKQPSALAQPPPHKGGFLTANVVAMKATGQRIRTGKATPATVAVHMLFRGAKFKGATGTATLLQGIARFSATGARAVTGTARLTVAQVRPMAARGLNSDDIQFSAGYATLQATVGLAGHGIAIRSLSHTLEIVFTAKGLTQKGVTLAPGIGIVYAGTPIAFDRVDHYAYPLVEGGPDGRDYPIGVLRDSVFVGDQEMQANVIVSGTLRLGALTSFAIKALVEKRNAVLSIGREILRF